MQNLCFGPECTILGYRRCEASNPLHWTQNDVSECFGVFRKPSACNKMQNYCLRLECTISETKVVKHPFYSVGTKRCLGVFQCILLTFGMWKLQNLCLSLNALFRGTKVVKHPFKSIAPKMIFGRVSEHFTSLRHVKRWKIRVFGLNALFRGTEVVKHPFYSIGPKLMFESVSMYFSNLRNVKRWKTYVFELNALFRGTKVVKRPIYSIGPKMMFGSV
jgi:hypothetical protein